MSYAALARKSEAAPAVKQPGSQHASNSLRIGEPDDAFEQEADRVADAVMGGDRAGPEWSFTHMSLDTPLRRKCAECEEEEGLQRKPAGQSDPAIRGAAPIVHEALRSPGEALDPATLALMEPRFGHDLSHVSVHNGSRAAQSAKAIGARAYTVGSDIVFAAGEYAPNTRAGRRLLAHELTHTLQQSGGSLILQRACVSSPCPAVAEPIDALFPRWEAAEKCIQDLYAQSHPAERGVSLSFNVDWPHLTGGTPQEELALGCLRGEETPGAGPNFTAKGGMAAAAPDIWDFRNQTIYEITTLSVAPERVAKLAFEVGLANRICLQADCGGLHFEPGPWAPPAGCFALGGDLFFSARNDRGVIIYDLLRDASKELALAALLALIAASMKNAAPKAGAAVASRALGKAVPAYAVASLAAIAVLLVSGRGEAKPGPGEEPLVTLFKALEQKGTPIPKEIKEMLEANPDLKQKLDAALAKGGDPTKLQEELNKEILDTIAANKDKFTPDELEALLVTTGVAAKALPKGDMTVAELKKLAAEKAAGKTGSGEAGQAGKTGGRGPEQSGQISGTTPPMSPAERLVDGMARKEGDGPKFTAEIKVKLLEAARAVTPPLSDKEVDDLLMRLGSAAGKSDKEVLDSFRKGLAALRASKGDDAGVTGPQPTEQAKAPEKTSASTATDDVVTKSKQGKKDSRTESILEKNIGWIQPGNTLVLGPKDLVFESGRPFSGWVAGRDKGGNLFFGRGRITPQLLGGAWRLDVPSGIILSGAAGEYGATKKFSVPAFPRVSHLPTRSAK
jgi:hypothetical protein